jgi:hypothetical protein
MGGLGGAWLGTFVGGGMACALPKCKFWDFHQGAGMKSKNDFLLVEKGLKTVHTSCSKLKFTQITL